MLNQPALSFISQQSSKGNSNCIGVANPAAVYCKSLGYDYEIVNTKEGAIGYCIFPDGSRCEEWDFYAGKCGLEYSYCNVNDYETVTLADGKDPFSREYTACIMPDKKSKPASELMNLSEKMSQCGVRVPEGSEPNQIVKAVSVNPLPTSFSWRNLGGRDWTTPVKNQAACGSCWAFSAVGAVEAVFNIAYHNPDLDLDLSEENLVSDCLIGHSCCGGWHPAALKYIRNNGIVDETCFPYIDSRCQCPNACLCTYSGQGICSYATCSNRCSNWQNRTWRIEEYGSVSPNPTSIKNSLINYGPLSVAMGIGSYVGGYWDGDIYRCTNDNVVNHAVVIVGYDDVGGYWIVRNSWGPTWNGDGHLKVGYGECSIEKYVYYAYVPKQVKPITTYLVVNGVDNQVYWRSYINSWGDWQNVPNSTNSDGPAAAACKDKLHLVVRGTNPVNSIWYGYVDINSGSFSGWKKIPGSTSSKPELVADPTSCNLYLVVRGVTGGIWLNIYDGTTWSGWKRIPGTIPDSPAIAILDKKLHFVIRASSPENSIWHGIYNIETGVFSGWTRISGATSSSPDLAVNPGESKLYLAVRGLKNTIYLRTWSEGKWSSWEQVPSGTTSDGPAITVSNDLLHIVVRGMANPSYIYHRTKVLSTNTWTSWTKLTGYTSSTPTLTTDFS